MERKFGIVSCLLLVLVLGFEAFGCDKHEREALLELKSAINHPNGDALADWLTPDCCSWEEVRCNGRRQVTTLFIPGVRKVEWYVNASLFLPFPHLQFLDLYHNFITGLTHHLGHLTSLQYLQLGDNKLQGTLDAYGGLCQLNNIQGLYIGKNGLQGQIPLCFRNLTSLQELDLSRNNFQGQLPPFLANFTTLRNLDLSSNQFMGNVANSPLTKLTSLGELILSNNSFQIPSSMRSFANHSNLDSLLLDSNDVIPDDEVVHPFLPKFQLSALSMSNCGIVAKLPHFIRTQVNLHLLDLSYNSIQGRFPSWILKNNKPLGFLSLANNSLTGLLNLPSHYQLQVLDVSNNYFSYLPTNLGQLIPSIWFLNLSRNSIKFTTRSNFGDMSSLSFLDLSHNYLDGDISRNCFEGCISLEYLFLSHNNLRVTPSLSNSIYLKDLRLNDNKLNGSLLSIVGNNTSLMTLDLSNNQLSGVIPKWMGDFHSLSNLILRNNNFQGEIPNHICSLDQLAILDLSSNNISGQIPPCLHNFTWTNSGLEDFRFQKDLHFYFEPSSMDDTRDFYKVISSITFKNEISITTKRHTYTYGGIDLEVMSALDLSCNNLNGEIPQEIGWMIGVHAVNLSHNNLIGKIPQTLRTLSQIESLDLSYNNLNGSIPYELIQLNDLEVFNVSYNNLSGMIPKSAHFETFDESSYRGNLHLCGPPILKDCFPSIPKDRGVEDVEDADGSRDITVFYTSFTVSSIIMFFTTLAILYVNPYWRRVWFYFIEMWITCVYYFIVDGATKVMKTSVGVILRVIHCH